MAHAYGPEQSRKAMVLCFDGTGNKFQGNNSDSNIIKIYGLLDRRNANVHSYYQPGIGTYIEDSALSKTSRLSKIRSAYVKAKDSAVGTSFDQHVMAAYDFLMKHYDVDDDLYFFGFSRGAYIARFLAQMLDSVGLLSHGNEEMMRFAWKAFANWQTRMGETEEQRQKKREMFDFMKSFRETFSRPVRRIRFLGLFDTVNSVPRFETAWMARAKFPYTCKSSAKVIRHAVSIDENRAKFRQNLISQKRPDGGHHGTDLNGHQHHHHPHNQHGEQRDERPRPLQHQQTDVDRFAAPRKASRATLNIPDGSARGRSPSTGRSNSRAASVSSLNSNTVANERSAEMQAELDDDDDDAEQDIQEIWFPGCHADIGGGWALEPGLDAGLSHAPLLWIIREARKAGVPFSPEALEKSGFMLESDMPSEAMEDLTGPQIHLEDKPLSPTRSDKEQKADRSKALELLHRAATKGMVHDSLKFGRGTPAGGVIAWNVMEYMPFRRMDLKSDGTWAPIRWPLPCGEPRDIPDEAWIHHTALMRMEADEDYRPGNLIIGGGGRGVKKAPKDAGTGKWKMQREKGSAVGECVVRAKKGGTWPADMSAPDANKETAA